MSDGQLVSASDTLPSTNKQRQIAIFALLAVTLVWGATFIWMKQALDALDTEKSAFGTNIETALEDGLPRKEEKYYGRDDIGTNKYKTDYKFKERGIKR